MTGAEYIQGQLATFAWRDGFADGLSGMEAVAFCIRNRQRAGWWNGDWAQILSHHRDYSYKTDEYPDEIPDPRVWSFQLLLHEISAIFDGSRNDDVTIAKDSVVARKPGVALYYARLDQINSDRFLYNIARKPEEHPVIAQIGSLSFFS
jgi:hypothetical protein